MVRKLSILSIFFLPSIILHAQSQNQAAFAIGTPGNDNGNSVVQTLDGGYAITGYSLCNACPTDVYVLKLDSVYNLKWARIIRGSNDDYGYSLVKTYDKGFAVSGFTSSYGYGGGGIYLLKLDSLGNLLWSETIQGQHGYSILQTADGGFAIAGNINTCALCPSKAYILKLDSAGKVKWAETIGGTSNDTTYAMIQTKDKGYALAGVTTSFGAGGKDMYLIKLDSSGNMQWNKTVGGTNDDVAYSLLQTFDGGYAMAGYTTSFGAGGKDFYVVKLDSLGNTMWTRTLGGTNDDIAKSIIQTSYGDIVVAGTTISSVSGDNFTYLVRLDSTGKWKWSKLITSVTGSVNSIIKTTKGFTTAGTTSYFGAGENDAYILLLDTAGNTCINANNIQHITGVDSGRVSSGGTLNPFSPIISIDTSATATTGTITNYCYQTGPTNVANTALIENKPEVFPDPATNKITLEYTLQGLNYTSIKIVDITGNTLFSTTINENINDYTIPVSGLANGIYIMQVISTKKTFYLKFIKQ
ncbi:MAG TPA: T9SS type A sorting domain-containing protein [Bacteroidia bacterium]|nr:T9SS type A sorting domain-containing protein [Bacteroidia bacterium]